MRRNCLAWCLLLAVTSAVQGQLPTAQLGSAFPAGAAIGSTAEITIAGDNLDETDQLWFSHPGITAIAKMADPTPFDEDPVAIEQVFLVTVASDVPAGRYEIRSRGKYGLSNPRAFLVSSHAEVVETEPNGGNAFPRTTGADDDPSAEDQPNPATPIALPATVHGQSTNGADVDWYRFDAQAGQRLLLDGYASRIDSPIDLVMTLFDHSGNLVGERRRGASGDPMIQFTVPEDGEYFLKVHDALFRNGPSYAYRIHVGSEPYLDCIFPPAGLAGSNDEYTVYGVNLPNGQKSNWIVDDQPLEFVKTRIPIPSDMENQIRFHSVLGPHQAGLDGMEYRIGQGDAISNPLLLSIASAPVVYEQDDNDHPESPQPLTLPCEVAGQFFPQRDVDWYSFEAKQGDRWMIDLISQRQGFPTDASLLIQRVETTESGETKVSDVSFVDDVDPPNVNNQAGRHEFDVRTTDPFYLFTAPADGTYRVLLRDGHSSVKSDPRLIYRLAIRKPEPDFRVVAVPGHSCGSLLLRRGGRQVVRVHVFRQDGYDGEIRVSASGLPEGVTSEPIIIGSGNEMGTLILTATDDAVPSTSRLQVTATGTIAGQSVTRPAKYGAAMESFRISQPNARVASVPARLVGDIQLCVTDYDPCPIRLTIGSDQPLETSRGGILTIPYQVTRADGAGGNLTGFAIDYPPQTSVGTVNIGTNASGEFQLRFQSATPPGTFTFYLAGFHQGYSYRRNPELAERAQQRQERITKILMDAQQAVRDTQQVANQKQTEFQQFTNDRNQAVSNKQAADRTVTPLEDQLRQAKEDRKQKQQTLASDPSSETSRQAAEAAQKVVSELEEKLQAAVEQAKLAEDQLNLAEASLKMAEEAKTKADETLKAARDFQDEALREKQRADQFASQKRNESNPRNINFDVPSNSLTITVNEFPITIDELAEQVDIQQGATVAVPIKLTRLYDFAGSVSFQPQLPGGVSGVTLRPTNLAADASEATLEISTQPNATPGQHACPVRIQMNFNGQNLTMERTLRLTVTEVKPEQQDE